MIEPGHEELSVRRQASLLGVNRNRLGAEGRRARASREADLKAPWENYRPDATLASAA